MKEIFLPTLHWFAMKNPFTGSCGEFRFRAVPDVIMATAKEVNSGMAPFAMRKAQWKGNAHFL